MKKVGIYVNPQRDPRLESARFAAEALISRGEKVLMDDTYKEKIDICDIEFVSHTEMLKAADLIVALGGDGTILKVVRDAAEFDTPVIGINLGHLGFLTQAEKDDQVIFDKISGNEYSVRYCMMLEARIVKDGKPSKEQVALNDIIFRGSESKMISLTVEVDGTEESSYLADGIIAATSTGSTAYSLSCGGPIVHQSLDCIILTPICPHTLKSRCIVIPPQSKVVLKFDANYCSEAEVKVDGNGAGLLSDGDCIEIVKSSKRAPFAILDENNYFHAIRGKLAD